MIGDISAGVFQFHNGAIGVSIPLGDIVYINRFQFHNGAIGVVEVF